MSLTQIIETLNELPGGIKSIVGVAAYSSQMVVSNFRDFDHEYFVPKELYQRVLEKCLSFDITILSKDLNQESTLTSILIRFHLPNGAWKYDRQYFEHRSFIHQGIWYFQGLHKLFCVEDETVWLPMLIE